QAATREELAGLAREIDGLAAFVARTDQAEGIDPKALTPPTPDNVGARDAETRMLLDAHPEALIDTLRARADTLRATMQRNTVRWRPDFGQIDDFHRVLDRAAGELSTRKTFTFTDPLDAWRHDALRRLLADLDRLGRIEPRVRAQRVTIEAMTRREHDTGALRWKEACAAIAASPRYRGLQLAPMFDLVPLGADPRSGLWEFLLATSGAAPERDLATQSGWRVDESTGLVLVLLPGGRFEMGQRPGEGAPLPSSLPMHTVELAPFFMSKFELTIAQAERLGGFAADRAPSADGRMPFAADWERARALLRESGLELPTEARWEYAARGGTRGALPVEGHANVNDRSRTAALERTGYANLESAAGFDDGWPEAAPAGEFAPNAFGLHDTLGNAAEWCLDHHVSRAYATLTPRAGDGLRTTVSAAQLRALRGGSFTGAPRFCHPAARLSELPGKFAYWIGVRPVRSLSPG
ncbi:MAG: formylglycine-generating enzyme family protein, partial [Planctomycetes bacterium]|nr:formylglycine-generating enzyme family protein [Planctomycetota bacterium]